MFVVIEQVVATQTFTLLCPMSLHFIQTNVLSVLCTQTNMPTQLFVSEYIGSIHLILGLCSKCYLNKICFMETNNLFPIIQIFFLSSTFLAFLGRHHQHTGFLVRYKLSYCVQCLLNFVFVLYTNDSQSYCIVC